MALLERVDDGAILRLHAGQMQAWDSIARFVLVLAGTQGGKTSFGPYWLSREIDRRGPGDYLAVTATYDLFRLKMLPALQAHFCNDRGWSYVASDRVLTSPSGQSRIILRSAEAEGGLEAATAKAAWLDECGQPSFGVTAWEAIQRRLAVHQGRALLTSTPYEWNWLQRVSVQAATDPEWQLVRFASDANPAFPPEQLQSARRNMPDWRFRMFYLGEFTRPAAAIFADYLDYPEADGGHVVPSSTTLPARRTVGVDFGAVNTGIVWLADDPVSGIVYAYRTDGGAGRDIYAWAQRASDIEPGISLGWGGAPAERVQRQQWRAAGGPMARPHITDVEGGIALMVGLIRQGRFRVLEHCYELRQQLISYSREVDKSGEIIDAIANKHRYHLVDACRYGCSAYRLDWSAPKASPTVPREESRTLDLVAVLAEPKRPRLEIDDYD